MSNHYRRCWECGAINLHSDNVAPEVCCKECGSQDTRRMKNESLLERMPSTAERMVAK
jgi:rRNA maturation endonuclease Nob1